MAASSTKQAKGSGNKRKRLAHDHEEENVSKLEPAPAPSPKRIRADNDESIKQMGPALLADYIAKKIKRVYRDLSSVELEEKYISQAMFCDTSELSLARNLDNLPCFLEHVSGGSGELSRGTQHHGSPHTLFIAASGLRAADVTRSLRKFQSDNCAVAKLFAKHIKLKDAIDHAKRTRIGIGVGTPQRLLDLLERDALKNTNLKRIVIDASCLDQKKRSIFDMKELLGPLLKLLSHPTIRDTSAADQQTVKILAF